MTLLGSRMTKLELLLLAWTALNVVVGVWILLTGTFQIYGAGLLPFLPLAIGLPAAGFLLWQLLKPTRASLLFRTLFWALHTVSVRMPDALYKFRLGLSVDFQVTDNAEYVVAVNLLAVVVTVMFGIATARRSAKPQAATA